MCSNALKMFYGRKKNKIKSFSEVYFLTLQGKGFESQCTFIRGTMWYIQLQSKTLPNYKNKNRVAV